MTYSLNSADLQKMTAREVAGLADIDHYSVRDEGFRRQSAADKKIARLTKQLEAARREMAEAATIIEAAFREQDREAA